jgi:transcriptional regulator GlxA family with amidase domain
MISDTSKPRRTGTQSRRVVLVGYDDAEILDLTGPASVFAQVNKLTGVQHYDVRVVGPTERIVFGGGLTMEARPVAGVRGPVDTLMVAGGMGFNVARSNPELVHHVGRLAKRARRVASVCSGTFLLAEAGLLDGRTATTHWAVAPYLADWYPQITVEVDRIYVRDGDVWSSAGVTAGIDLTLALVANDLGEELAHQVARWIVLPVRRSGGQSQYSAQLAATVAPAGQTGSATLAPLLSWMAANLDADMSVAALAQRVGWGERHFARRFKADTGRSPARHVEDLRLDAARQLLETTDLGTDAVAARCGFASREVLHRAFQRRLATTPTQYRGSFSSQAS